MRKKLTALILLGIMVFALVACNATDTSLDPSSSWEGVLNGEVATGSDTGLKRVRWM